MDALIKNRNTILKIFGFLIFFHSALFANSTVTTYQSTTNSSEVQTIQHSSMNESKEMTSFSLDFSGTGMVLMLIFGSLLGAFFVRDEFGSLG